MGGRSVGKQKRSEAVILSSVVSEDSTPPSPPLTKGRKRERNGIVCLKKKRADLASEPRRQLDHENLHNPL